VRHQENPVPSTGFRLYYLDDSGSPDSGLQTFTWLALDPACWQQAQQRWLGYRRSLARRYRILASTPLHATDLVSGRSQPSTDPDFDTRKHGAAIVREGLDVIAALPWTSAGTAYRHGGDPSASKSALYRAVVEHLDADLHDDGSHGMIVMDGAPDERLIKTHRDHHRTRGRRLIEQPHFHLSRRHQWVQMADFAAWAAFQSLVRNPAKAHTWNWYERTIGRHDQHGPISL
jgi:hypothetical protein